MEVPWFQFPLSMRVIYTKKWAKFIWLLYFVYVRLYDNRNSICLWDAWRRKSYFNRGGYIFCWFVLRYDVFAIHKGSNPPFVASSLVHLLNKFKEHVTQGKRVSFVLKHYLHDYGWVISLIKATVTFSIKWRSKCLICRVFTSICDCP